MLVPNDQPKWPSWKRPKTSEELEVPFPKARPSVTRRGLDGYEQLPPTKNRVANVLGAM